MHAGTAVKMGRGYLNFAHRIGVIKQVCRGRAIAKWRTMVGEISSSSEYCKPPLSGYVTYVIQTLQEQAELQRQKEQEVM